MTHDTQRSIVCAAVVATVGVGVAVAALAAALAVLIARSWLINAVAVCALILALLLVVADVWWNVFEWARRTTRAPRKRRNR